MNRAVIVSAIRTPIGKVGGSLSSIDPVRLGEIVMKESIERVGIDPSEVDEVIFGNTMNFNNNNIARLSWLEAGLPLEVPNIVLNRRCASSLSAIIFGAMMIQTGNSEIILSGGVESYSKSPFMIKRPERGFPMQLDVLNTRQSPDFMGNDSLLQTAEYIAEKYDISRQECDEFAFRSHELATNAWSRGYFDDQVIPVRTPQRNLDDLIVNWDECVRKDCTVEGLSKLRSVVKKEGSVTAGNSSPMNDGASAILLMSEKKALSMGLEILATVNESAAVGCDPRTMGIGPVPATNRLFKRTGYTFDDIDLIEINEAFASQSIACLKEMDLYDYKNLKKVNVNGGAISIGHPNSASGGILVARMVYELRRRNLKRGLITFCVGGGQGVSLIIESAK